MDKTDGRIKNETHRVGLLDKKSTSFGEFSATVALLLCTLHQGPGNNKPVHHSDLWPSLSPSVPFSSACKWQSQNGTLWSASVLWALTGPSACDLWVCYWSASKGEIRQRHLERSFTQIFGKFCKTLLNICILHSSYGLILSLLEIIHPQINFYHHVVSNLYYWQVKRCFLILRTFSIYMMFRTIVELRKRWQKFPLWVNYSFNCIFYDVINDYSLSDFSSFVHANHVWST